MSMINITTQFYETHLQKKNYDKRKQKCINYVNVFEKIFIVAFFRDTVKSIIP